MEKPVIPGRTSYWKDIAVLAVPAEGVVAKDQVIDLTSQMDATGRLVWTPPPGKWVVYRFGHTTMGALTQPNQWEAMGLECDKMSGEAVAFHLRHVIGELKKHLGPLVGTGLRHMLLDSYEAGKPSWTPLMPQEFAQRRGYDLKAFLPTFAKRMVGSEGETKKFQADFDRTIADLYRDKCFVTMSKMLAEENLSFVCEPYGGPFHTGEVTPYIHRVMNEFWSGSECGGTVQEAFFNAGPGKRHNILEAEAFTGAPGQSQWSETPAWLKPTGDGAFAAGINRLILHSNPLQPWRDDIRPGMTMGQWGTHFGRTQTWWEPGRAWLAYLARCQALLQWGAPGNGAAASEGLPVRSLHRSDGGSHVFFLAHSDKGGNAICKFPVEGMQPELWDPVTGKMRELTDFRFENGKTVVPL
ncbi:MAG: glycosyl hydrolase, partial [Spartobacteria bacterium]